MSSFIKSLQSCDYIKPTILCRGWRAGCGKQEPRFQNQTGLGWKSDSSHGGLHFLSEPQFPHLSIQVERAILNGPPHNASSPGAIQGTTTRSFELLTTSKAREMGTRSASAPRALFQKLSEPPWLSFGPQLSSNGAKHHTQDPRSQTYHLGWAQVSREVLGWIAYCFPSLCLPGLSKMLEAYSTGDTHSKSATH